jgi:arginine-tRNA-protein transferase
MVMLSPKRLGAVVPCVYLHGERQRHEWFLAYDVTAGELDRLLEQGWRKFGTLFFRPSCPSCSRCIPTRIVVARLAPSKSQRRLMRRNGGTEVRIGPRVFGEALFEIYREHSRVKFGRAVSVEQFVEAFYIESCPSLQSEYYIDGRLAGAGFLDRSRGALSSVYFVYDPSYGRYGLGVFSVLHEAAYARSLGLSYYYLGYCVEGNRSMSYKARFSPNERRDWESGAWRERPLGGRGKERVV